MAAAYPLELRRRILRAYTRGDGSIRELAKRFGVAPNTVQNYRKLVKETGTPAPRAHGGGVNPRINAACLGELDRILAEMPDATLADLANALAERCHVVVSVATLSRTLNRARHGTKGCEPSDRA